MAAPSSIARLTDIIEAVELIRSEIAGARVGVCAAARTAAASLAMRVPSKKRGFWAAHSRSLTAIRRIVG